VRCPGAMPWGVWCAFGGAAAARSAPASRSSPSSGRLQWHGHAPNTPTGRTPALHRLHHCKPLRPAHTLLASTRFKLAFTRPTLGLTLDLRAPGAGHSSASDAPQPRASPGLRCEGPWTQRCLAPPLPRVVPRACQRDDVEGAFFVAFDASHTVAVATLPALGAAGSWWRSTAKPAPYDFITPDVPSSRRPWPRPRLSCLTTSTHWLPYSSIILRHNFA